MKFGDTATGLDKAVPVARNRKLTKTKYGPGSYFTPRANTFTQKSGPRAGQTYVVRKGKSGQNIRVYQTGDTAIAK